MYGQNLCHFAVARFMAMCGNAVDTASRATWSLLCRGLPISASAQARSSLCLKTPAQYWPIRRQSWRQLTNRRPADWGQHPTLLITAPSQSPAPSTAGRLANQSKTDWELCQPLMEQCLWSCDWVLADWDGSQSVYTSDSRAQLEVTQSQQHNDMLLLIIRHKIQFKLLF